MIEPWTPVNSLTWGKPHGLGSARQYGRGDRPRHPAKTLTPEQVSELYPTYPQDHPVIVNEMEGSAFQVEGQRSKIKSDFDLSTLDFNLLADKMAGHLTKAMGPAGDGIGSNSWAVSGAHTASGMPLLDRRSTSRDSNAFDLVPGSSRVQARYKSSVPITSPGSPSRACRG